MALLIGLFLPMIQWMSVSSLSDVLPITDKVEGNAIDFTRAAREANVNIAQEVGKVVLPSINWVLVIMLLGIMFSLWRYGSSLYRLFQLYRLGDVVERDGVKYVYVDGVQPFSFFNFIFLDRALEDQEKEQIILHERAHVLGRHWFDLLVVEVIKIPLWWHPPLYLFSRYMSQNHEYLADAAVLRTHVRSGYLTMLLKQRIPQIELLLAHTIFQPNIKKRIAMMYKESNIRFAFLKLFISAVLVSMLGVSFMETPVREKISVDILPSTISALIVDPPIVSATSIGKPIIAPATGRKEAFQRQQVVQPIYEGPCKKNKLGIYWMPEKHPYLQQCARGDTEEAWECTIDVIGNRGSELFEYPEAAMLAGYEPHVIMNLMVDEEGNIFDKKLNVPSGEDLFGVIAETERIFNIIKDEYTLVPGECSGERVKTSLFVAFRYKMTDQERQNVVERNPQNTPNPNLRGSIHSISSDGNISLEYNSMWNTPVEIVVKYEDGEVIYKETIPHIYKRNWSWGKMKKNDSGRYTVIFRQSDVETTAYMDYQKPL